MPPPDVALMVVGEGTSEQRVRGGQVRTLASWESRRGVRDPSSRPPRVSRRRVLPRGYGRGASAPIRTNAQAAERLCAQPEKRNRRRPACLPLGKGGGPPTRRDSSPDGEETQDAQLAYQVSVKSPSGSSGPGAASSVEPLVICSAIGEKAVIGPV